MYDHYMEYSIVSVMQAVVVRKKIDLKMVLNRDGQNTESEGKI